MPVAGRAQVRSAFDRHALKMRRVETGRALAKAGDALWPDIPIKAVEAVRFEFRAHCRERFFLNQALQHVQQLGKFRRIAISAMRTR